MTIFRRNDIQTANDHPTRFAIDGKPPRFYPPRPSAVWGFLLAPLESVYARRVWKLDEVLVEGIVDAYERIGPNDGVLIAPNHSFEGDAYVLRAASKQVKRRFYFMADWRAFRGKWRINGWLLQRFGVFSVDRDGSDRQSIRTAIDLLCNGQSLVVFPEGEIHHLNQRLTPFLEGVAFMAMSAQRQLAAHDSDGRVWIVPAGIRYRFSGDVRPELEAAMSRLENRMFWTKPPRGASLRQRILHFGDMLLTIKEKEKLGRSGEADADLPTRVAALIESLLSRHESRFLPKSPAAETVALRVKALRRRLIDICNSDDKQEKDDILDARDALDDVQLALQLYSYPGNYITDDDALMPMAETIEKFKEDVYGITKPTGRRRARIVFGEPIDLRQARRLKQSREAITDEIERATAALLERAGSSD